MRGGDNSFMAFLEKVILFKKLYLYDMLAHPPTKFSYDRHASAVKESLAMQQRLFEFFDISCNLMATLL